MVFPCTGHTRHIRYELCKKFVSAGVVYPYGTLLRMLIFSKSDSRIINLWLQFQSRTSLWTSESLLAKKLKPKMPLLSVLPRLENPSNLTLRLVLYCSRMIFIIYMLGCELVHFLNVVECQKHWMKYWLGKWSM